MYLGLKLPLHARLCLMIDVLVDAMGNKNSARTTNNIHMVPTIIIRCLICFKYRLRT